MSRIYRQQVVCEEGQSINVAQKRGHLSYCFSACCCGRTDRGYDPVPVDAYKSEWLNRKMRNAVHLTKGGCLGPCALANVASLLFDGRSVWFHSMNSAERVRQIFEYIDAMLRADRFLPPPEDLRPYVFDYYDWEARASDGGVSATNHESQETPEA